MSVLPFAQFDTLYQASVQDVFRHWTAAMQTLMARHCHPWRPETFDFHNYLRASAVRFYQAYRVIAQHGANPTVCDVGGFWGVLPLTLKELGFTVAMTESLKYYGNSFTPLFDFIAGRGVEIVDYDPFAADARLDRRFDVVTVMAVLEHYPHSLKTVMHNIAGLLSGQGRLYIEVPNIAYWPKRTALLRGRTPLPSVTDIYRSDVPFIGHHHEFTMAELRALMHVSGLTVLEENSYNYTPGNLPTLGLLLRRPVQFLAFSLLRDARECLTVLCRRDPAVDPSPRGA